MKRVYALAFAVVMMFTTITTVYAAEIDENEQYVMDQLKSDKIPMEIKPQYINQLENYFNRDDVALEKGASRRIVDDLTEAFKYYVEDSATGRSSETSEGMIKKFQSAGEELNLVVVYDSKLNDFHVTDKNGIIVIDTQKIIKDTDKDDTQQKNSDEQQNWNISIELIFAIVIVICLLGVLANLRKWYRKLKRRSSRDYDDDDDEDELEVANKKTRRQRMNTLSYRSVKQLLRYCYVPIIFCIIVVGTGFLTLNIKQDVMDSVFGGFIKSIAIAEVTDTNKFVPVKVQEKEQKNSIEAKEVVWPKYSFQYGILVCNDLNINAPVYFGDRGNLLVRGAGTYIGSSIPGYKKTTLIGAHDTTYFKGLEDVKKGNEFVFTTSYGIYRYEVTDTKVYAAKDIDTAYNLESNKEELVLYTCYPFGTLNGSKSQRMFVYLNKVSGPEILK